MGNKFTTYALRAFLLVMLGTMPLIMHGQIIINEIQYNPEGTDGGYEWIELYNSSEDPLSIEGYKFRESDQNHRLTQVDESLGWTLPGNGFALIAENPTKFLEKHPGYPGLIFDSSFTLVNTGELLEILNLDGELVFGFEYNPEWGGNGDGSTLGLYNDQWQSTGITPGRKNTLFSAPEEVPVETPTPPVKVEVESITPVSNIPTTYIRLADPDYQEKTIKADGGSDRTVLVGVPFIFKGAGYGWAGGLLTDPTYHWNFGDGQRQTGKEVIHHYSGPGTYIGTLTIKSGPYTHTDHFSVRVIPPEVTLSASTTAKIITITNNSPHTIELSGFSLKTDTYLFNFPEESFINGSSQIVLDAEALGIQLSDAHRINLRAPNDHLVTSFHGAVEQIKKQIALQQEPSTTSTSSVLPLTVETADSSSQVVYVGVPQSITPTLSASNTTFLSSSTQSASLPLIKRETFSLFEKSLFGVVTLCAGLYGLYEYRNRKKGWDALSIEEL